jgi:hypothetical protein
VKAAFSGILSISLFCETNGGSEYSQSVSITIGSVVVLVSRNRSRPRAGTGMMMMMILQRAFKIRPLGLGVETQD